METTVKKEYGQEEIDKDEVIPLLKELADLYGKRGCCKKRTCYHHKAKVAIDRITELEEALKGVCKSIEFHTYVKETYIMDVKPEKEFDEYDYMMSPLWIKAYEVLNGGK